LLGQIFLLRLNGTNPIAKSSSWVYRFPIAAICARANVDNRDKTACPAILFYLQIWIEGEGSVGTQTISIKKDNT